MKKNVFQFLVLIGFISCNNINIDKQIKNQEDLKKYIEELYDYHNPENIVPDDKFIFLEIKELHTARIVKNNSKIIEISKKNIDFPMYCYNDSLRRVLTWDKYFKPNKKNLKFVLGKGTWLGENVGSGGASGLDYAYYFPYFNKETAIYEVDKSNTVYMRYKNIYYKAVVGGVIKDSSFYTIKIGENLKGRLIVKKDITIINHGLIDKNKLISDTIHN
jgi:hypothetical protein